MVVETDRDEINNGEPLAGEFGPDGMIRLYADDGRPTRERPDGAIGSKPSRSQEGTEANPLTEKKQKVQDELSKLKRDITQQMAQFGITHADLIPSNFGERFKYYTWSPSLIPTLVPAEGFEQRQKLLEQEGRGIDIIKSNFGILVNRYITLQRVFLYLEELTKKGVLSAELNKEIEKKAAELDKKVQAAEKRFKGGKLSDFAQIQGEFLGLTVNVNDYADLAIELSNIS